MSEKTDKQLCREAFVKMIRKENFESHISKYSLRQSWKGPEEGFADYSVQSRYDDFKAGWGAKT